MSQAEQQNEINFRYEVKFIAFYFAPGTSKKKRMKIYIKLTNQKTIQVKNNFSLI